MAALLLFLSLQVQWHQCYIMLSINDPLHITGSLIFSATVMKVSLRLELQVFDMNSRGCCQSCKSAVICTDCGTSQIAELENGQGAYFSEIAKVQVTAQSLSVICSTLPLAGPSKGRDESNTADLC